LDSELVFGKSDIRDFFEKRPDEIELHALIDQSVWENHSELILECVATGFSSRQMLDTQEGLKTFSRLADVCEKLTKSGLTKTSTLVSIGGGSTSDLGTVIAGNMFRGINHIIFPTTLLAQVDAGIGGKGALNINSIKNSFGCFHFPQATCIETDFFKHTSRGPSETGLWGNA